MLGTTAGSTGVPLALPDEEGSGAASPSIEDAQEVKPSRTNVGQVVLQSLIGWFGKQRQAAPTRTRRVMLRRVVS